MTSWKREMTKLLLGGIAADVALHIGLLLANVLPLKVGRIVVTGRLNTLELLLWPLVAIPLTYAAWLAPGRGKWAAPAPPAPAAGARGEPPRDDDALNRALREGYPSNHRYALNPHPLIPGRELRRRWRDVSHLYSAELTSLLDVGCCKGFFVLDAAQRPACHTAIGIDVERTFIELARAAAARVRLNHARFHFAHLREVAADPAAFGGPFQTVLLLNTYHYLYWGSDLDPTCASGHGEIFGWLARVCDERLILASPLELRECPDRVQAIAAAADDPGKGAAYTRVAFLEAAAELFDVRQIGRSGGRPLFLMLRRQERPNRPTADAS